MPRNPCSRWLMVFAALLLALSLAAAAHPAPLADSVILLIGDGMGPTQITVAREARGAEPLAMEKTPLSGLVTTNSANSPVTDSAAAATALATGHKTNNGMISVGPREQRLFTLLEKCQAMYKSTGLVTMDALHGATPAAFATHVKERGMASDIALQLSRSSLSVMLGFWKDWFLPESAGGKRTDGRDLLSRLRRRGYDVVFTKETLAQAKGQRLVGLFDDGPQAPTLAEMTKAALERLRSDPDGFFLLVEGARIDWKGHANDPAGAVLDTWQFDEAVAAALECARTRGRTLVVVTADHETGGMGIADRSRLRLLGNVKASAEEMAQQLNADRTNAAAVLGSSAGLPDLTPAELQQITSAKDAAAAVAAVISQRAGVTWSAQGHTATPVRVFAFGPEAQRFVGHMDNTDIPKRIAAILGITRFPQ